MIGLARRAIASLSDAEPLQPYIDIKNVYTSAFAATIAIYLGSYTSLRVRADSFCILQLPGLMYSLQSGLACSPSIR